MVIEGYDDAKAAVIEAVLKELEQSIKNNTTLYEKVKDKIINLLKKINWLKLGGYLTKKAIATGISLATANPLPIMLSVASDVADLAKTSEGIEELKNKFVENQTEKSPAKTIREIRDEFKELLAESEIKNLIVTIDDLDRCLPEKIIETLEAVKLFLSVERSTFIFAVDDKIIRYAIKRQYPMDDGDKLDIAKDYIEKIIQIPVVIPQLSTKDVQNYLLLLVTESYLKDNELQEFLQCLDKSKLLIANSKLTKNQIENILAECKIEISKAFSSDFEIVDSISKVVSSSLKGNPRQAKRFLNAFNLKKELSYLYFENEIDLKILAKLMALYVIDEKCFVELRGWFNQYDGETTKLKELVLTVIESKSVTEANWSDLRLKEWLLSEPQDIYKTNLSNYFYLTRDMSGEMREGESLLSEQEKTIISEIMNISYSLLEKSSVMEMMKATDNEINVGRVKKTVIEKYISGSIGIDKISIFFIEFQDMRDSICDELIKKSSGVSIKDVGYIRAMNKNDPDKMKRIIESMPDGVRIALSETDKKGKK